MYKNYLSIVTKRNFIEDTFLFRRNTMKNLLRRKIFRQVEKSNNNGSVSIIYKLNRRSGKLWFLLLHFDRDYILKCPTVFRSRFCKYDIFCLEDVPMYIYMRHENLHWSMYTYCAIMWPAESCVSWDFLCDVARCILYIYTKNNENKNTLALKIITHIYT